MTEDVKLLKFTLQTKERLLAQSFIMFKLSVHYKLAVQGNVNKFISFIKQMTNTTFFLPKESS